MISISSFCSSHGFGYYFKSFRGMEVSYSLLVFSFTVLQEKVKYYDIATEKREEFHRAMTEYTKRVVPSFLLILFSLLFNTSQCPTGPFVEHH